MTLVPRHAARQDRSPLVRLDALGARHCSPGLAGRGRRVEGLVRRRSRRGVVAVVTGLQGGSLALGIAVGVVCGGVAYLLVEIARALWAWRGRPVASSSPCRCSWCSSPSASGRGRCCRSWTTRGWAGSPLVAVLVALAGLVGAFLVAGSTRRDSSPPVL